MGFGQQGFSQGIGDSGSGGFLQDAGTLLKDLTPLLVGLFGPQPVSAPGINLPVTIDPRSIPTTGGIPTTPVGLPSTILKSLPGVGAGVLGSELFESLFGNGGNGGACGLFKPTKTSGRARPASVVAVADPVTGEPVWFGHLGRPMLWSRDLRGARSMKKLAGKLSTITGRHPHRSRSRKR